MQRSGMLSLMDAQARDTWYRSLAVSYTHLFSPKQTTTINKDSVLQAARQAYAREYEMCIRDRCTAMLNENTYRAVYENTCMSGKTLSRKYVYNTY